MAHPDKAKVNAIDELPFYEEDTGRYIQQNKIYRKKKIYTLHTEYAVIHEFPAILQAITYEKIGVNSSTKKLTKAGINNLCQLLYGLQWQPR